MNSPKTTLNVQVDVRNPGQFFACCGLLEVAHRLWPKAEGWFDEDHFVISVPGLVRGLPELLFKAPLECEAIAESDGIQDPKIAPVVLGPPISMRLDWWLSEDGRPNRFKTWAANATSCQMFVKWIRPFRKVLDQSVSDPWNLLTTSQWTQGSYGFDSDVGWDALKVGFSLNEHTKLRDLPTRPAAELFGAIGLQRFFPAFDSKENFVEYAPWIVPLRAPVARLAVLGIATAVIKHRMQTKFVKRASFKGLAEANII